MPTPLRAIPQYNIILGLLLAIFFLDARMHSAYRKKASRSMLRAKKSRLNYGKKSFTNCDGDYYHAGSDFETYTFGTKTGGAARANRGLTKYSGVQFCYEAMPISAANAAEGVQHKGLTAMLPKQWSERIPNQTKWGPPITPTSGSDPVALTQILIEAPVHLGTAGAIVVEIWEVKGQWYYVLPPETVPERQLIPIDKIGHKVIACGPLKNGGAGLESLPPLPAGPAVTTRDLTDLKPNVPPDCEIPKGTEVTVQHVYSHAGKVDIRAWQRQKGGKTMPEQFSEG